jgi:hypothetical protein
MVHAGRVTGTRLLGFLYRFGSNLPEAIGKKVKGRGLVRIEGQNVEDKDPQVEVCN